MNRKEIMQMRREKVKIIPKKSRENKREKCVCDF